MRLGVLSSIACWSMVKCSGQPLSHSIVLGALVGVPSLAHNMGSSGWSFKSIKSWKSTSVYSAKIVYLLGILTAALMFHFLSVNPIVWDIGEMKPPFNAVFFVQSCISWPWNCDCWITVPWGYLQCRTQFLESGDGSLYGNREKLGLRQMQCPHKPRHLECCLRVGWLYNSTCCSPHGWGILWMTPNFLEPCLGIVLNTGHAVTASN